MKKREGCSFLRNKSNDYFSKNSSIEAAHNIIGNCAHSMMKSIKVRGGPNFNDIKKSKQGENKKEMVKRSRSNKRPSDEHTYHFIDNYPLGIMKGEFFLNMFSN